jgi:hypothetical protein
MISFEEIEDCMPDGMVSDDATGCALVSAQWLHDFANAVTAKERESYEKEPKTIYIVVQNDRHINIDVRLFSNLNKAIEYAIAIVEKNSENAKYVSEDDAFLTQDELDDAGWLFYRCYSVEGDCIYVIEGNVDNCD